jgi:hypothetical protein
VAGSINNLKKISNLVYLDVKYSAFHRKKFFEDYAAANEFDPLVPENWYSQSRQNILASKVYIATKNEHPL